MLTYWLIFGVIFFAAIAHRQPQMHGAQALVFRSHLVWVFAWICLTLLIGLRYEVGGDWYAYYMHVENVTGLTLWEAVNITDPSYAALNWVGANLGGGVIFVNTVCAALFSWGLIAFCKHQPNPWLALLVAVPFCVIVVAMGYTRQAVALGLAMLGFTALLQGRFLVFVFWVTVAATFHKSAVILIPLAIFAFNKVLTLQLIAILVAGSIVFYLLLLDYIDNLFRGYIVAEMDSVGAWIRIIMNALPAALFLLFRGRFDLKDSAVKFWTWFSVAGIAFIPLLMLSPSSTAVDRIALYWLPLQIFVFSRLPYIFQFCSGTRIYWVILVSLGAASVQFVWLFFAIHANYWLPYQFFPWVWLWS